MPWMQAKAKAATPAAKRNAPVLRKALTEPERRLWTLLRRRLPQDQSHFRRQVALGPYIVDFACMRAKLIIEADGDQHGSDQALRYDADRTAWLTANGFTVLRFTNRQIMTETEMVLDTVFAALSGQLETCPTTPTTNPSPQAGGEEIR
jgi:very-short-patch-repair endonuclease